jgi:hypothetical protein
VKAATIGGIHQLDAPCWTVVRHDGTPAGFEESVPHYETEAAAIAAAPDYNGEDEPPVQVKVDCPGFLCTVAELVCGQRFVYEGDTDEAHFADAATVLALMADDGGLIRVGDGMFACTDPGCHPCRQAIGSLPEPADVPLPGQAFLFGPPAEGDPR